MNLVRYDQNVRELAKQLRFRRIGSPYAFLESIGFEAIREQLYRGANLVDVAEQINISVTVLRKWLDDTGRMSEIDAANTLSADGYLAEGQRLLKEASSEFELKKAKELINHARWLAERLNKPQYGKAEAAVGQQAGVQYNFYLNGAKQSAVIDQAPIDGNFEEVKPDVPQFYMPRVFALPEPENIGPFAPEPFDPSKAPMPAHIQRIVKGN